MTRSNAQDRLTRLDQLAAQLKQDRLWTVQDLSAEHGVSARTIARDLALMRAQGLPIETDRGRGGGVRLSPNWGVGRVNLSYPEAIDLLISLAVAEKMNSPLFLANLGAVRRQLVASFSAQKRQRVDQLKSRIMVGATASPFVQADIARPQDRVVRALHQAFLDQEMLAIRYQREDGETSDREIAPHYLLLKYPVWYVIAFDQLRAAPRTFRCDRILSAQRTGTTFSLRPKSDFQSALDGEELAVLKPNPPAS